MSTNNFTLNVSRAWDTHGATEATAEEEGGSKTPCVGISQFEVEHEVRLFGLRGARCIVMSACVY